MSQNRLFSSDPSLFSEHLEIQRIQTERAAEQSRRFNEDIARQLQEVQSFTTNHGYPPSHNQITFNGHGTVSTSVNAHQTTNGITGITIMRFHHVCSLLLTHLFVFFCFFL